MGTLVELKEMRERAGVTHAVAAEWIGKSRIAYTKKELWDNPTLPIEYDLVKLKLERILEEKEKKEVVPPCGILDREHVESICRKIGGIYGSGNKAAINSLECHLEGLVSMLSNKEAVTEIMLSLNVLMNNHEDLRRELNTLKTLIKTEGLDEKAVGGV